MADDSAIPRSRDPATNAGAPARRREVMRRSQALGHCICDVSKPCPCDTFLKHDRCPCAGERPAETDGGAVRLTEWVRNAGCASKIGKGDLHRVLDGLPDLADPRVLVGRAACDDAAVVRGEDGRDTVLTVDVFTPPVDDPYAFGRIAAANSLSDIYAMGARPDFALSIIGFPIHDLPGSAMRAILAGGIDCMAEAGVPVVGGHSLNDAEVKAGFAVVGSCPRGRQVRNAGVRPGDCLLLTKPLGGGFLAFAHQVGRAAEADLEPWRTSMATLNKAASEAMLRHGASACTDLTGFGLLGHLLEVARQSRVLIELGVDDLPLFPGVRALARAEVWPGAVERNREGVPAAHLDLAGLAPAQQALLYGPETSGGLLIFLPPEKVADFVVDCAGTGVDARLIGRVVEAHPAGLIRAVTSRAADWSPLKPAPVKAPAMPDCCPTPPADTPSCCAAPPVAATGNLPAPAGAEAFAAYQKAVNAPGALDLRTKKLIALALSVQGKCEPCVHLNAKAAREAGADEAQLAEAVGLGIAFGGAPTAMFYSKLR